MTATTRSTPHIAALTNALLTHLALRVGAATPEERAQAFPEEGKTHGELELVGELVTLVERFTKELELRYPGYELDGASLYELYGTPEWCPTGGIFLYDAADQLFMQLMIAPGERHTVLAARALNELESAE